MVKIGSYDVIVVGAGHAGIEAALVSAKLKASTAVFTLSLDAVGNLPCNPSIGGTAKAHLVFEIDAMGGEIGNAADATSIQSRTLNLKKGPAVHSLRVQTDRLKYTSYMKHVLEKQSGLDVIQDEVVGISVKNNKVAGVYTRLGAFFAAKCVIIATGTYLGGKIFVGPAGYSSGPDSVSSSDKLAEDLKKWGVSMRRFKTGTPARVHRRSLDFSKMKVQSGDEKPVTFSFMSDFTPKNLVDCYITATNERTHEIIRNNLDRSPLYAGMIEGVGPRYCPSIEDKIVRFPDKKKHQLFVEPCGLETEEMYLQGMSSSLPIDVQYEMYRTVPGLEKVELMRPAYAIEYECCDPTTLKPSLESRVIEGLFGAGQFCGTSGYEEAAALGFVAGVNAARKTQNKQAVVFERSGSYLGTMIDDLVTKGVTDPYRIMTSRSEYRLVLRQDNADRRMCEIGREIGSVDDERYERFQRNSRKLENELARMKVTGIKVSEEINEVLSSIGEDRLNSSTTIENLLKRPRVSYEAIKRFDPDGDLTDEETAKKAEIEIKYEGYIKRQKKQVEKQKKYEKMRLREDMDYRKVHGLRIEAVDKLSKVMPLSIGQASRVSGVSPADIAVLTIWLRKHGDKKQ
ncbi:MAG: tRNA uridine-5-carboxymethylaminomethyl(34) synthesis enzyme MnmG [Ruminococcaceae bacterium]|nr:tRNA uridine-5-carboxymethylaminomethyl(34) synthesis enzyme MnmG [Oscillospiraceae bacterium]